MATYVLVYARVQGCTEYASNAGAPSVGCKIVLFKEGAKKTINGRHKEETTKL